MLAIFHQLKVITDDLVPGLEYVKQLCVPEYNTVEMEVASK